jgi:membrane protease YdiL (CAAX protease family)
VLDALARWVSRPISFSALAFICAALFLIDIIFESMMISILGYFKFMPELCAPNDLECKELEKTIEWLFLKAPLYIIIPVATAAAFGEEMLFRWLPLISSVRWIGAKNALLFVALPSSLIFGWVHYASFDAKALLAMVVFQGFGGVIYSIAYLKAGGAYKRHSRALLTTTVMHALFNLALAVAERLFPGTFT